MNFLRDVCRELVVENDSNPDSFGARLGFTRVMKEKIFVIQSTLGFKDESPEIHASVDNILFVPDSNGRIMEIHFLIRRFKIPMFEVVQNLVYLASANEVCTLDENGLKKWDLNVWVV